jgi:hypothetical protein
MEIDPMQIPIPEECPVIDLLLDNQDETDPSPFEFPCNFLSTTRTELEVSTPPEVPKSFFTLPIAADSEETPEEEPLILPNLQILPVDTVEALLLPVSLLNIPKLLEVWEVPLSDP